MNTKPSRAIWLEDEEADREAWHQMVRDAIALVCITLGGGIVVLAISAAVMSR